MTEEKTQSKISKANRRDLTQGKPFVVLLMFTLPMLLSMAFQQLYNIVDSVVAGQFIGKDALAAVGASSPVTLLFLAIATGSSIGCGVIVSQLFGRGEHARLKTAIFTSLISITALAVVLTVVGIAICDPLLRLLNTPESIFSDSSAYLSVYIWGLVFIFAYNIVTCVFNGLGDSRTPLYLLIFSSLLNIGLDVLFVTVFKLGVPGLAWATFIAQALAAVVSFLCLVFRIRKIKAEEGRKVKAFDLSLLKTIAVVAVPSICQQSFVSVGQLCIQSVINGFGEDTIGGYTAAMKVSFMAVSCFTTLSSALSSFTGQNLGAGKPERIKEGLWCSVAIGGILVAVFVALFLTIGERIVGLFVSGEDSAEVMKVGGRFLSIVGFGYPFVMFKVCLDGVLRGSGDMLAFMISTFSDLVIRVALSYILAPFIGFLGVCLSFPIGWVCGVAFSLGFFLRGKWKTKVKV